MKTEEKNELTRAELFKKELKELLAKHRAEIDVYFFIDHSGNYSTYGIRAYLGAVWNDSNGDITEVYTVVDLGSSIRP